MKVIFFDIDGTLIDFDGVMSDSTRQALDLAKAQGHKLALCTGRNEIQIYPLLSEYGFDAIVSAAGACVSCEGQEVFHHFIDMEHLKKFVDAFDGRGICFGVQATSGIYVNEESKRLMQEKFRSLGVGDDMMDTIVDRLVIDNDLAAHEDVEKTFYNEAPETVEQVQDMLGDYFLVQEGSFSEPDEYSGEITCRGIMKATGMGHVLKYFGVDRMDSVAFGDGPNDLDMMEYASIGVAMGNAREEVKDIADMVTDDIHADGIYNAMKKLELI